MTKPILNELQEIFDNLLQRPVALTTNLSADEIEEWDSVMHISIIHAMESRFGIRFEIGEVDSAETIGDYCNMIERKMRRSDAA